MSPFVLLADFEGVIKIFFAIIVPLIWIVSQIVSATKNQKDPAGGKPLGQEAAGEPQPNPQPQRPQAQRPQAQGPAALSDEIDKFLQRMTNPQGDDDVVDVQVLDPHEIEHVPQAAAIEPRRAAPPLAAEIVPIEAETVRLSNISDGVSSHVQQHIGSSSFEQQVSRLGEVTGQADERVEQRLHQKFDHQVGRLSEDAIYGDKGQIGTIGSEDMPSAASPHDYDADPNAISRGDVSPITDVFASPAGIRRAIILNEILRRPDDRW